MDRWYKLIVAAGIAAFGSGNVTDVYAKVPAAEAAKLGITGTELTPTGATRAGNADGTIPEWTGGITKPPANFVPGSGNYVDPYADDSILFTITAQNYKQYADRLSDGQVAMFEKFPETFKMNIYPTRRSYSAPERIYERSIKNAMDVNLSDSKYDAENYFGGQCFPIPNDGYEARLNTSGWRCIYQTEGEKLWYNATVVDPTGSWQTAHIEESHWYPHYAPDAEWGSVPAEYYVSQIIRAPARLAGQAILLITSLNYESQGGAEKIWSYNPGQRRVRRAPQIQYDYPKSGSNGLMVVDQAYCGSHGNFDRYNWALNGKKELFVPYNNYALTDRSLSEDDIIGPNHMNPDLVRYELHRVWVIEGEQRPEFSMAQQKRVIHADEDSWYGLINDIYDSQGNIWKLEECMTMNYYDYPVFSRALEAKYDIQSAGYVVLGIDVESPSEPKLFGQSFGSGLFTVGNLKGSGIR